MLSKLKSPLLTNLKKDTHSSNWPISFSSHVTAGNSFFNLSTISFISSELIWIHHNGAYPTSRRLTLVLLQKIVVDWQSWKA